MKTVYFAGPLVFHPRYTSFIPIIKKLGKKFNFTPLIPGDGNTDLAYAQDIYAENMAHIHRCHIILADITPFRGAGVDDGTAFEIGAGAALGKTIYTYCNHPGDYRDKVEDSIGLSHNPDRDRHNWIIEDFSLPANLMISEAATQHIVIEKSDLYREFKKSMHSVCAQIF
jgi:nucleoside 2-deoxyribosyltransferase